MNFPTSSLLRNSLQAMLRFLHNFLFKSLDFITENRLLLRIKIFLSATKLQINQPQQVALWAEIPEEENPYETVFPFSLTKSVEQEEYSEQQL